MHVEYACLECGHMWYGDSISIRVCHYCGSSNVEYMIIVDE